MTRVSQFRRVWSCWRLSLSNCWITTVQDGNASGSWSGKALALKISGRDEIVDHLSGALYTLDRDAAATRIAEEEAPRLRPVGGAGLCRLPRHQYAPHRDAGSIARLRGAWTCQQGRDRRAAVVNELGALPSRQPSACAPG